MSNPHFESKVREIEELQWRNRIVELEKLHWPKGKTPHDHPELDVHDGRLSAEIHPTAWVADCVTIGKNVVIGPNTSIGWGGFGYTTDDNGVHHRREHPFGVVIEDDVEIGAGVTIDRGRYRDTVIGPGTKIDANVFIAHNCLIGKDCLIIANSQISGSCEIGDNCHIGPAAMLTDHIKVGAKGRCGMGAVVVRDVPGGVTVVGNPARDIEERRQKVDVTSFGANARRWMPGLRVDAVASEECKASTPTVDPAGFGDGSDEFSLPGHTDMSEIGQRQRAMKWR